MNFNLKIHSAGERFLSQESGSVQVMAALVITILIASIGIGLDFSKSVNDRQEAQQVLDAALLAGGKNYRNSLDEKMAKKVAQKIVDHQFLPKRVKIKNFKIAAGRISGEISDQTKTIFLSVIAVKNIDWTVETNVNLVKPDSIEFALAIDISSSMEMSRQMGHLKNGLLDFSQAAFSTSSTNTVVSLVPFGNAVSFPSTYSRWLDPVDGYSMSATFHGCFVSEASLIQASTSDQGIRKFIATPNRIHSHKRLNQDIPYCPADNSTAQFFIDRQTDFDRNVKKLEVSQGTNTAAALSWGWRALSPSWKGKFRESGVLPKPVSDDNKKILVLFSDGKPNISTWAKQQQKDKVAQKENSIAQFKAVCKSIQESDDVDLYTIGYGTNLDSDAQDLLESCTSGIGQYFSADKNNISEVFQAIVGKYSELALIK